MTTSQVNSTDFKPTSSSTQDDQYPTHEKKTKSSSSSSSSKKGKSSSSSSRNIHKELNHTWIDKKSQELNNEERNSHPWNRMTKSSMFELDPYDQSLQLSEQARLILIERKKIIDRLRALKIIYEKDISLPSIHNIDQRTNDELKQLEIDFDSRINLFCYGHFSEGTVIAVNKLVSKISGLDENALHDANLNNRYLQLSIQELSRNLIYLPASIRAPFTYICTTLPLIYRSQRQTSPPTTSVTSEPVTPPSSPTSSRIKPSKRKIPEKPSQPDLVHEKKSHPTKKVKIEPPEENQPWYIQTPAQNLTNFIDPTISQTNSPTNPPPSSQDYGILPSSSSTYFQVNGVKPESLDINQFQSSMK